MERKTVLTAGILFGLFYAAAALGSVRVTTATGNGADAGIYNDGQTTPSSGGPDVNTGDATSVQIRRYDGTRAKAFILRFDIHGLAGDTSGSSLSVSVAAAYRTRTMNVYGLTDGVDELWNESAICYNNAPGMITDPMPPLGYLSIDTAKWSLLGSMSFLSTPDYTNTGTIDLSSLIGADTNGVISLLLYSAISDSAQLWTCYTKEGATITSPAPTLTFPNAVPEPATLLLGLGGLMLRRKK